jgi:hypothetical protein
MEIGNRYFRVTGRYIDFAVIKRFDFKYTTFACTHGDSHYKSGPYTWITDEFLKDWTLYTELNKALV